MKGPTQRFFYKLLTFSLLDGRYHGEVKIGWHHNHPIIGFEPLTRLRVTDSAKQMAQRLFQEGLTPAGL